MSFSPAQDIVNIDMSKSREEKSQKDYSACNKAEQKAAKKRENEFSPEKIKQEMVKSFENERNMMI